MVFKETQAEIARFGKGDRHSRLKIQFRSGRPFAAWLGLTPLQHSSGGKERLGRISKMGDKYLRRLLVVGMTSLIRRAKYKLEAVDPWLADLLSRKPARLVTVALANKAARVVWAIMVRGGVYRMPAGAGVMTPL
jgi:transposase